MFKIPNVLRAIIEKYKEKYNRNLEDDIKSETSGAFCRFLFALLQCKRSYNTKKIEEECEKIAQEILEAEKAIIFEIAESVFAKYFSTLSSPELIAFKKTRYPIFKAIDAIFLVDSNKILTSIIYAILCPKEYFAKRINYSIKGFGIKNKVLIRVLVSRSEIDLPQIKDYYKELYEKDMIDDIKKNFLENIKIFSSNCLKK